MAVTAHTRRAERMAEPIPLMVLTAATATGARRSGTLRSSLGASFSGLLGFGPWGWGLNWFAHSSFLIPSFFAHFFGGWWGIHGGATCMDLSTPATRCGCMIRGTASACRTESRRGVALRRKLWNSRGRKCNGSSRALSASRGEAGRAEPSAAKRTQLRQRWSRAPAGDQFAARNYSGHSFLIPSFGGTSRGEQGQRSRRFD